MKYEVRIGETARIVEIESEPTGETRFRIDCRTVVADASEIAPGTYSILLDGHSFEIQMRRTRQGLRAICGGQEFRLACATHELGAAPRARCTWPREGSR